LPWHSNDARTWTTLQGARYGESPQTIQRRYLISTAVMNLLDPTFIYSCYDLFYRFLVHGERTGAMPSIHVGPMALWAGTHVDPMPWGLEYNLHLLGRFQSGNVLEIAPRAGTGAGGWSAGIAVDVLHIHVLPELVVDAVTTMRAEADAKYAVILGDMNDDPASAALVVFGRGGFFPAHPTGEDVFTTCKWREETGLVRRTIDYILVQPAARVSGAEIVGMKRVPQEGLPSLETPSDHLPLTATVEFPE